MCIRDRRIPRNHRIEEAIEAAAGGDFSVFHRLVDGLARPFDDDPRFEELEEAPRAEQCVTKTFCGT